MLHLNLHSTGVSYEMTTPLFSTYSQQENLVTSTFLAALQRLSLPNMDRILQALLDEKEDFRLVTFENQPKFERSIPDARIGTRPGIVIETKIARDAVGERQVRNHLRGLRDGEHLLLLTPDDGPPSAVGLDDRVIWSNFSTLSGAIEEILRGGDNIEDEPPSEREAFLLRELNLMLSRLGLTISPEDRVMVVPAAQAWPMYNQLGGSRRKRDISYRPSDHMAFYTNGKIMPLVPRIRSMVESINMTRQDEIDKLSSPQKEHAMELRERIDSEHQSNEFDDDFMVMFLSEPDDCEDTVRLDQPIINDKKAANGKPWAFVLGFSRYVTLESLRKASRTSDLEFC